MTMEMSDFAVIKELVGGNNHCKEMTDYEEANLSLKQSKKANGATVTAIVAGFAAVVLGATAWGFAQAKSKGNEKLIEQQSDFSKQMTTLLAGQIAANRTTFENAKAAQDTINITTTQSGTQNTSVSQSALAQAEATLLTQSLLGNVSQCPQKVSLYSAPQPCGCA